MMGDPSTVASAYGIPGSGTGFGLSSGGLPPEGMLYGHSFAYILGQLLALQTAGFNNPSLAGPQITTDRSARLGSLRHRLPVFARSDGANPAVSALARAGL